MALTVIVHFEKQIHGPTTKYKGLKIINDPTNRWPEKEINDPEGPFRCLGIQEPLGHGPMGWPGPALQATMRHSARPSRHATLHRAACTDIPTGNYKVSKTSALEMSSKMRV